MDIDAYNWLISYFEDVNVIDKESDSFRFPFRILAEKNDNIFEISKKYSIIPIFEKQTHINLVSFANKMELAFGLLKPLYKDKFGLSKYYNKYKPTLIEEGGYYYGQSVVGYKYNYNKFYPYVKAYTESAEYFYELICEDDGLKDTLFIPMCYLYRNALELALKEILLEECSFGLQKALIIINKKKHSVLGLWNQIKNEIIERANASDDNAILTIVEKYITQLHNFDGNSDKFRYPTNQNLALHFKKKKIFDIDNVNLFFGGLLTFLSAVDATMSEYNEWKAEMEMEYRSEIEYYDD